MIKDGFNQTIVIEDPFILTHNLADKLTQQSKHLIIHTHDLGKIRFFSNRMDTYLEGV